MKVKFNRSFSIAALITTLAACGGGGSSGLSVGYFVDSAVKGLGYSTATQSGVTDESGKFSYLSGETVTFSLYGKDLISPLGFSYLTPFDLGNTDLNPNYSINLVRFLMALDEDGDASNGIQLPTVSAILDVEFNKSIADFETDADGKVSAFLNAHASARVLPSVRDAAAHLNTSLTALGSATSSYSINLTGKTARSVITNSFCSNDLKIGWTYSFAASEVTLAGSDTFITNNSTVCTAGSDETLTVPYSTLNSGELFDCAPICSYAQLNRVTHIPSDADGREALEWQWHTPNTKFITSTKTIINDPSNPGQSAALSTFYEVITLD